MIFEDMPPKKVAEIKNFLKEKKALVVDSRKTSKATIKRTLIDFGVNVSNIYNAISLSDAKEIIADLKIDIVITSKEVKTEKGISLIEDHQKAFPNRSQAMFILLSEANSPASVCAVLESEVDEYFIEPFTGKSLSESLLKLVQKKMEMSPFKKHFHKTKECIYLNQLDEADLALDELKKIDSFQDEKYYLEGIIYKNHGDLETSLLFFEKAVEENPKHYLSLQELIEGHSKMKQYERAYHFAMASLRHFPINPVKLPNLIRLSLTNKKYEDLIKYAKFFSSLEEQSPSTKTNIAASLVLCSKYFFENGNRAQGVQTLLEAVKASSGKASILKSIIEIFLENNEIDLAYEILNKFLPIHGENEDFKILEIEIYYLKEDVRTVLKKGIPLAESGQANKKVFEALIVSSIKTDRKQASIENLIDIAQTKYPDSIEYFSSLYKK